MDRKLEGGTFRAYFRDKWVVAHRKAKEILKWVEEDNYNLRSRGCSVEE